jgi:uncharacterized UPF0160 family protein
MVQRGKQETGSKEEDILLIAERLINQYNSSPEVRAFLEFVKNDKFEKRKNMLLAFVMVNDDFVNKMVRIAEMANRYAVLQQAIMSNHENQLKVIDDAITSINKANGYVD